MISPLKNPISAEEAEHPPARGGQKQLGWGSLVKRIYLFTCLTGT